MAYSHMTNQFTQSLPAVFGAHLAVLEGEWSRKNLIECKMEERNECKQRDRCDQMDEMNRWTDGTETDVSRGTD